MGTVETVKKRRGIKVDEKSDQALRGKIWNQVKFRAVNNSSPLKGVNLIPRGAAKWLASKEKQKGDTKVGALIGRTLKII